MSKYIKLDETVNALIELNAKLGSQRQAKRGVRFAIGYVKDLPTIEVSEDCISREWFISFIDAGHLRNPNEKCYSENDVVELIKNAPSVVPKPNKEYDYSKSVLENIKAGNGISRDIPKEASEDLISRQDAIDALVRSSVYAWSAEENQIAHDWALKIISELPAKESDK